MQCDISHSARNSTLLLLILVSLLTRQALSSETDDDAAVKRQSMVRTERLSSKSVDRDIALHKDMASPVHISSRGEVSFGKASNGTHSSLLFVHDAAQLNKIADNSKSASIGDAAFNGDVIWLKHVRHNWLYCDTGTCRAAASCPSSANQRKVTGDTGCYGERFKIYNGENSGPINSGDMVWLKSVRHKWLYCDANTCRAAAGCPDSANQREKTGDTGCYGERFKIYNSANEGRIKEGDVVWLKHVRHQWLYCDSGTCRAAAGCPNDANHRKVTSDTGCYGERFKVYVTPTSDKCEDSDCAAAGYQAKSSPPHRCETSTCSRDECCDALGDMTADCPGICTGESREVKTELSGHCDSTTCTADECCQTTTTSTTTTTDSSGSDAGAKSNAFGTCRAGLTVAVAVSVIITVLSSMM